MRDLLKRLVIQNLLYPMYILVLQTSAANPAEAVIAENKYLWKNLPYFLMGVVTGWGIPLILFQDNWLRVLASGVLYLVGLIIKLVGHDLLNANPTTAPARAAKQAILTATVCFGISGINALVTTLMFW